MKKLVFPMIALLAASGATAGGVETAIRDHEVACPTKEAFVRWVLGGLETDSNAATARLLAHAVRVDGCREFIEQTAVILARRDGRFVQIRPQGETTSFWTMDIALVH